MQTLIQQLEQFLQEAEERFVFTKWLADDKMKVYVRKGRHILSPAVGKAQITLDVASVDVLEEFQGQGLFSEFLEKAHEMNPWEATYVENVLNPRLGAFLVRSGWMVDTRTVPESYFMPKNPSFYETYFGI